MSAPHYAAGTRGVIALKNQTLLTAVRPYTSVGLSITEEDHAAMHTDNENSEPDFPHSFLMAPIHEKLQDTDSTIVSIMIVAFAWDAAWRSLLPTGVDGIFAVLRNSCGQAFTYEISGPDALYRGEGDLHDIEYDSYEVVQDLSLHSHAEFESTPGHCYYSMVSSSILQYSTVPRFNVEVISHLLLLLLVNLSFR